MLFTYKFEYLNFNTQLYSNSHTLEESLCSRQSTSNKILQPVSVLEHLHSRFNSILSKRFFFENYSIKVYFGFFSLPTIIFFPTENVCRFLDLPSNRLNWVLDTFPTDYSHETDMSKWTEMKLFVSIRNHQKPSHSRHSTQKKKKNQFVEFLVCILPSRSNDKQNATTLLVMPDWLDAIGTMFVDGKQFAHEARQICKEKLNTRPNEFYLADTNCMKWPLFKSIGKFNAALNYSKAPHTHVIHATNIEHRIEFSNKKKTDTLSYVFLIHTVLVLCE